MDYTDGSSAPSAPPALIGHLCSGDAPRRSRPTLVRYGALRRRRELCEHGIRDGAMYRVPMPLGILLLIGVAGALAAPCRAVVAQAVDSTGMPSLELLAAEAGRASRRHPIRVVSHSILCEPGHPLVDSLSLAACAGLDSVRAAAITAAFARGLEVPLSAAGDGDAAVDLPICPKDLDQVAGPRVLVARVTAPLVGMREGRWEGRLTVELRCRPASSAGGGIRTMGKEYLYEWNGRAWGLYQHAWFRAEH